MENHFYYLLAVAIAPVLAGLGYIFAKDKYNKEPIGMLLGAFFLGVISIIPICIAEGFLESFGNGLFSENVLLSAAWTAFIVAAFTEENIKLFFLKRHIWSSPEFDERFDGIVYGVFVSLGFACAENILYIFSMFYSVGISAAYNTSIMRAIFSIPCHFFCGVILGYYLSLAKFETNNGLIEQNRVIKKGLIIAILFHGFYDFVLMYCDKYISSSDSESETASVVWGSFIMFLIINLLLWKFGKKRIYHMASLLQPNSKNEMSAFVTCSSCGKTYISTLSSCPNCKQPTQQTLLGQNDFNNDFSKNNLHNSNQFAADYPPKRPPKDPFEM